MTSRYRTEQIQRWRRARRAKSDPHYGLWALRIGAGCGGGCLLLNLLFVASILFGTVASVATVYAYFAQGLPDPSAIETKQDRFETVRIYDRTGEHLLFESIDPRPKQGGDRTYLRIDQIPPMMRNATIALEDRTFYTNIGINPRGIGRAFISNLRGLQVQGGSSITMQLVKNVLISERERYETSYARKIKEAIMAIEITRKYPGQEGKDQILEWYINFNNYGNLAYGAEAAARVYYNKSAADLTLDEVTTLAAIPQYPALNPIWSPEDAYRRQRKVLAAMVEAGFISEAEAQGATRYFNTRLLNELVKKGFLTEEDLPLVATGDKPATARALNALVKANMGVSQVEADAAKRLPGSLWQYVRESAAERFEIPPDAPHFAVLVLDQIQRKYNTPETPYFIWQNGLRVYTTLDWDLQVYAECVARAHIAHLSTREPKACQNELVPPPPIPYLAQRSQKVDHEVTNSSVVAIRPNTGEVLVMVGSLDYFDDSIDGQVNIAISSRQPGSSFKPYTYLTAFESGNFAPSTMVMDVRTVFPDPGNPPYVPENYDRSYHGPQSLRAALQRSYNIPAVWLMDQVGVGSVIRTARRVGVSSLNKDLRSYGLSLTLGGGEVTLLDHTYAYSVLANSGVMAGRPIVDERQRTGYRKLDPVFILQVRDKDGKVLEQYDRPVTERVVDPAPAYMLNHVMSDTAPRPAAFGTFAQYLELPGRPMAAKTGTTNNFNDDWTLGYTPQLAVGVWTGNADNKPMKDSSGSLGAAPIFHAVIKKAMEGQPVERWTEPPGLQHARVCVPSGMLPSADCPATTTDLVLSGRAPTQQDTMFQSVEINRENGMLASPCTPADKIERKLYQIYPLSAADWVREKQIPQPPTRQDDTCGAIEVAGDVAIGSPYMGQRVKGVVPIMGNARGPNFRAYTLEVASESAPNQWIPIGPEHGEQISNGQLEVWDTEGFDGLYTLRLAVMQHDGGTQTNNVQLAVDRNPPDVKIIHPTDGKPYVMEDDEYVSITAEARDTWEMDRVEFYLDGRKLGESTVSPYSLRWTITMSNDVPVLGPKITSTRAITSPDGTVRTEEYVARETRVEEYTRPDGTKGQRLVMTTASGFGAIVDSGIVTETHRITVKAFDRAGNEKESEPVYIRVMRKPKPKPTSYLWREEGSEEFAVPPVTRRVDG
jgi:membrane peptidoglycan carboxypeptidase